MRRVDPDNPSSIRSLARLAGNLNNKPAARNDHTAQPVAEPTLNRFAFKPLALGYTGAAERVVMLVKNDPSTSWYRLGLAYATDHVALSVRVRFTPGAGQRAGIPNFASSILVFGPVERTWADYTAPTMENFFAQQGMEEDF